MTPMFTVCPKCALTLAVTPGDLRVAQGYVRCGRCSNVFNALTRLSSDDRQAGTASAAGSAAPAPLRGDAGAGKGPARGEPAGAKTAGPLEDDDLIPEAALEFDADVTKVFVEPPPAPQRAATRESFKPPARSDAPARVPARPANRARQRGKLEAEPRFEVEIDAETFSATLENPALTEELPVVSIRSPTLEPLAQPAPQRVRAAQPKSAPVPTAPPATPVALRGETLPAPRPASVRPAPVVPAPPREEPRAPRRMKRRPMAAPREPVAEPQPGLDLEAPEHIFPPPPRQVKVVLPKLADPKAVLRLAASWTGGTVLLSALLALQILNHYRNDLATNARLNRPLTQLYAAFGVRLVPRWDLNAYDVRQLGASADSARAGQITVRASVKNAAHRAQPMPLLRVTLQDRFGNRIAARDVPPQSYLPAAIRPSSYLSAGQRIDAEMAFVDPGPNAEGFEIDACLPAPGGGTACASESVER
jgi:predicted Zn finger-like uncharacterized protein